MKHYYFPLLIALFLLGCNQQVPQAEAKLTDEEKSSISEEVKKQSEELGLFFNDYDASRLSSLFSEGGGVQHLSGIRVAWSAGEVPPNLIRMSENVLSEGMSGSHEYLSQDIEVISDNFALETIGFMQDRFDTDGNSQGVREGARTILWHRSDSGWRIKHVHVSYKAADTD